MGRGTGMGWDGMGWVWLVWIWAVVMGTRKRALGNWQLEKMDPPSSQRPKRSGEPPNDFGPRN